MKSYFNRKNVLLWILLTLFPFLGQAEEVRRERAQFQMGTICEIVAYGSDPEAVDSAIAGALDEIARLDRMMSSYRRGSELSRLSPDAARHPVKVSSELFHILSLGQFYAELTGGAFDITVEPLIELWDLRGKGRVPSEGEIQTVLPKIGPENLVLDPERETVRFKTEGVGIDLGGIGKGYAIDVAIGRLKEGGVRTALLNLGGNLFAWGSGPEKRGWTIEVADPEKRDRSVLRFQASDLAVSTSGLSERFVQVGQERYGHILDPRTGYPTPPRGSVTVVSDSAAEADALSTALFVMGREEGLKWVQQFPQVQAFYLVPSQTREGEIDFYGTENLSNLGIVMREGEVTTRHSQSSILGKVKVAHSSLQGHHR